MDIEGKLRFAAQSLASAEGILRKAADAYPFLDGPGRAFRRMAKAANRPLRIGILGEANSGKSSLANLLAGVSALPADPVANTRLPALLKYAAKPSVTAIYESGERIAFPVRQNVAQVVAAIQDSGGKSYLPAGKSVPPGRVKIVEVGLPSDILHSVEILDLPAGHRGLPGYGMDAAIWTTVATQAWRESERAQWTKLPRSVRSRSLLAVTFCDLVAGRENNLKRLQARLETSAKPHFRGICFVANGDLDPAAAASRNKVLSVQIQYLAQEFTAERVGKAMSIARRLMANAIAKLGPGTEPERNGLGGQAVAEASRGLFDGDWVAALKRPLPEGGFERPSILRSGPASGAAVKAAAHKTTHASPSWAAGESSKERPRWMTIGAAALVGGAVTLGAIQLGLIGTDRSPSASEAVEQGAAEKAEKRRKDEAEAAAAEARGKAEAEAAAAEVPEGPRRKPLRPKRAEGPRWKLLRPRRAERLRWKLLRPRCAERPRRKPLRLRRAERLRWKPLRLRLAERPKRKPLWPRLAERLRWKPLRQRCAERPRRKLLWPRSAERPRRKLLWPRSAERPRRKPLWPRSGEKPRQRLRRRRRAKRPRRLPRKLKGERRRRQKPRNREAQEG